MSYNKVVTVQGIISAIERNRLVVVCGAGTTAATVPSSPFGSWLKLLDHGIESVVQNGTDEEEWAAVNRQQLEIARHPSDYISVAQNVASRLGRRGFVQWLHDTIGSLVDPERPELIEAISSLGMPIATTNYDGLIEKVTNRERITWRDFANMQRALNGAISNIMHMHGSYLEPDSVVFGSESYGAIVDNKSAQSVQWLMAAGKSILFVGASGTLEDPNLGRLLARIDEDIPDSGNEHYLLCRASERSDLTEKYRDTPVVAVSFGSDNYEDLPKFIIDIGQAAGRSSAQQVQQGYHRAATDALMQRIQSESIVAIDETKLITDIDQLLVPPVLLCAPHEQILSSISEYEDGKKEIRSDVDADAHDENIVIIVGEEISGVTTALEWLIMRRTGDDLDAVPVLVDFTDLTSGVRGLDRLVRRNLAESCGIPPHEALDHIVLGVDDVIPRPGTRMFDRFVQDLKSEWLQGCFVSCAPGAEAELISALEEAGITPSVRYMGRMTRRDVRALVRLAVDDERADTMLEKVQETLNAEGLPKTAWNIALLLDVFLNTSLTIQSVTPVTLLDQFVSSLLGREVYEDSRMGIDARDREAILSTLASLYTRGRAGALPEEEIITFLTRLFEDYGWNESPTAMLDSLKARHVLTTRRSDPKNMVRFAQSSYLYLFAAKHAKEDSSFKEDLLNDALFYSKIITHYAALVRNDDWVLEQVHNLVDRDECSDDSSAAIFGPPPARGVGHPLGLDSVVAAVASADTDESESNDDTEDEGHGPDDDRDNELDYYMENAMSRPSEPFPARDVRDAPHLQKAILALSLVSNVLRDSELVKNMPLKVKTLKKTAHLWADMVYLFEQDEDFQQLITYLAELMAEDGERTEKEIERSKQTLTLQFPMFFCMTAMMASLSSRKLEVAIKQSFDELIEESPKSAIMISLLSWSAESEDWPSQFFRAAQKFSDTPAVFDLMFSLARSHYVHMRLSASQRTEAEKFFRIILERGSYNTGKFMERLRADRVRASASNRALGR